MCVRGRARKQKAVGRSCERATAGAMETRVSEHQAVGHGSRQVAPQRELRGRLITKPVLIPKKTTMVDLWSLKTCA